MKFFTPILIICISWSTVQAQTPCKTPPQWEGRLYEFDQSQAFSRIGNFSYDQINKRIKFVNQVKFANFITENYESLLLFNQGIEYKYNVDTKACTKLATSPWTDYGVPANSQFIAKTSMGSPVVKNSGLAVNIWATTFKDASGNDVVYTSAFTPDLCIPISVYYGSETSHYRVRLDFYDITPGIVDPSIWTPRPECLKLE